MNKCSASSNDQSNSHVVMRDSLVDCDNIQSLSVPDAVEVAGKTSFVQEACESVRVMGDNYVKPKVLHASADLQDVARYYERPRLLKQGTLATTRSQNWSQLFTASDVLQTASGSHERVKGAYGFRATMVFTLQVAATPFHQGIAVLAFQYWDGGTYWRGREVASVTNIPHVRLDVSETTMVQLRVPFMSFNDFLPILSQVNYGQVQIATLTPVVAGVGVSAATYKLYYHVEDLELFGVKPQDVTSVFDPASRVAVFDNAVEQPLVADQPTLSPSPPTSSPFLRRSPSLTRFPDKPLKEIDKGSILAATRDITNNPNYVPQVEYQMGKPYEQEFEQESKPYSSGLYSLSKTLGWIAKGVPSIATIAGPASWFTARAAGALRAFGYARPQITDPPMRNVPLTGAMENNIDVPTVAQVLGPMASNHLAVSPAFSCTNVDESSFAYMLSQYNQIFYGTITTGDTHGTVKWFTPVTPNAFYFKTDPQDLFPTSTVQPSTIMWLGTMFKYWRGTVKLRFTFSKTKMHGGRVLVCYVPNTEPSTGIAYVPATDAVGLQPDGHSAIFDLKDGNVFEFEVPYMASQPYIETGTAMPLYFEFTGTVSMTIVDPLLISSMVSPTINYVVEICGLSDNEFAAPVGPHYPADCHTAVSYQSGMVATAYGEDVSTMTMGEIITSAKQLISIPKSTIFGGVTGTATANVSFDVVPWYYQPRSPTARESHGYGGNLSHGFTYVKGSTDHHIIGNTRGTMFFRVIPHDTNASVLADNQSVSSRPYLETGGVSLDFRFPSYQRCIRIPARAIDSSVTGWNLAGTTSNLPDSFLSGLSDEKGYRPTYHPRVLFWDLGGSTTPVFPLYKRHAGDDAALAHYIGPPPIRLTPDLDTTVATYM